MKTKCEIVIAMILAGLFGAACLHAEDAGANLVKNSGFEKILPLPAMPPVLCDYSLNPSQKEVLNTLRMSTFRYKDISVDKADKKMREMRDIGYNAILTEGQRFLFCDDTNHPPLPDVLVGSLPFVDNVRYTKIVADACHRNGMKVYLHLTLCAVPDYFADKHPDWMTLSVKDGKQKRMWGLLFACLNNDDFLKAYFSRLDILVKESGADGLMIDETSTMYETCGCPSCREKFRKDTGLALPETSGTWFGDLNSPLYKTFLAWRIQNHNKIKQKIREVLLAHKSDGVVLAYHGLPYYEKAWAEIGASIDDVG
ncbi:MAG: hypothetical protein WCP55_09980, partial [Lentisphaerota bacterium]